MLGFPMNLLIKHKFKILFTLTLLATPIVSISIIFRASLTTVTEIFFNSDMLMMHNLYKDLITNGNPLSEWSISAAPNFFPDMFAILSLNFITNGNFVYASYLYIIIQPLVLLLLSHLLLKQIKAEYEFKLMTALNLVFICILIMTSMIDSPWFLLFNYVYGHSAHFGNVIMTLIMLNLVIYILKSESKLALTLLFITTLIGTVSNRFFILFNFVPIIIFGLAYAYKKDKISQLLSLNKEFGQRYKKISGIITLSTLVGLALFLFIKQSIVSIQTLPIEDPLGKMFESFYKLFIHSINYPQTVLYLLLVITLVMASIKLIKVKTERSSESYQKFGVAYYLLVLSIAFTAPLILGLYFDPLHFRYSFIIYFIGLPILILWQSDKISKISSKYFVSISLILVLYPILFTARSIAVVDREEHVNLYPVETRCLDDLSRKYDLRYGAADYWNATFNEMFSKEELIINQFHPDLEAQLWNNTKSSYQFGFESVDFSKYDFLMTDKLDKSRIAEVFNTPIIIEYCGSEEVYIFR